MSHQYFEASDVPVYHKIQLENYSVNQFTVQKRNLSYAKYSVKTKSLLFEQINTTLSRQRTNEKRESQKNGSPNLTEENDQIGTTGLNINFQSNFSKNWKASSGVEAYHDAVQSDKIIHSANSLNQSRGLYLADLRLQVMQFIAYTATAYTNGVFLLVIDLILLT